MKTEMFQCEPGATTSEDRQREEEKNYATDEEEDVVYTLNSICTEYTRNASAERNIRLGNSRKSSNAMY